MTTVSTSRTGLALLALLIGLPSYTLLIVLSMLALFGVDVAALKGLAWALDTPEHRLWLLLTTATLAPVSAWLLAKSLAAPR